MREQRRARAIAMTAAEVDDFLTAGHTCRVATCGPSGPHATPLWFVWHVGALWLYSLFRSQRWADLQRDPRIAVVVDAGEEYAQLRGVELRGNVEVVGDVPRAHTPHPVIDGVEAAFAAKYGGGVDFDGRHAWLQLRPEKVTSWDFRKLAERAKAPGDR
jgi:hypothetical protein